MEKICQHYIVELHEVLVIV